MGETGGGKVRLVGFGRSVLPRALFSADPFALLRDGSPRAGAAKPARHAGPLRLSPPGLMSSSLRGRLALASLAAVLCFASPVHAQNTPPARTGPPQTTVEVRVADLARRLALSEAQQTQLRTLLAAQPAAARPVPGAGAGEHGGLPAAPSAGAGRARCCHQGHPDARAGGDLPGLPDRAAEPRRAEPGRRSDCPAPRFERSSVAGGSTATGTGGTGRRAARHHRRRPDGRVAALRLRHRAPPGGRFDRVRDRRPHRRRRRVPPRRHRGGHLHGPGLLRQLHHAHGLGRPRGERRGEPRHAPARARRRRALRSRGGHAASARVGGD